MTTELVFQYATSLFNLLDNREEATVAALSALVVAMNQNRTFFHYLIHPQIPLEEKKQLIQKIVPNSTAVGFLLYAIERKTISLFPLMFHQFLTLLATSRNEVAAKLITAAPTQDSTMTLLKNRLEKSLEKTVHIKNVVEPKIRSGALLIVGNRMADYTLKGRLNRMKQFILRNG